VVECAEAIPISFLPPAAYLSDWLLTEDLSLSDMASSSRLADRRNAVERGVGACAANNSAATIYRTDCELMGAACPVTPSLTWRHARGAALVVDTAARRLRARPRVVLLRTTSPSFSALLRLAVFLTVSFVFFARSGTATSSPHGLVANALKMATGGTHVSSMSPLDIVGDAAVGVLALTARATVVATRAPQLADDGLAVVVAAEAVAVGVSALHFSLRNLILEVKIHAEPPRTKLGGSMALCDATTTAIVLIARLPLLAPSTAQFEKIAGLLVGLLFTVLVLHRTFYAAAACGVLVATVSSEGYDRWYSPILSASLGLWLLQAVCSSTTAGVLFFSAKAFNLARSSTFSTSIAFLFTLGALCLTASAAVRTAVKIARGDRRTAI
jgi:hypothetical protein